MHADNESWKDSVHQSGNLTATTSDKDKYSPQAFILWPRDKGFEANLKIPLVFTVYLSLQVKPRSKIFDVGTSK